MHRRPQQILLHFAIATFCIYQQLLHPRLPTGAMSPCVPSTSLLQKESIRYV